MTLSTACKAAIKAVVYLASRSEPSARVSLTDVAKHIGESEHTVGKMLQSLVKARIIKSSKGPGGGFYISTTQISLPLMRVVESIDGKQAFTECGLGLNKCSSRHPCPIHHEYKKARELYENIFKRNLISDLCQPVSKKQTWLT